MHKLSFVALLLFLTVAFAVTPLNHYVNYNDEYYRWELSTTITNKDYTAYNIFFTSQKWLTHGELDVYIWHHWLQVVVPTAVIPNGDLGFIYINGGSNAGIDNPPTDVDSVVTQVSTSTGLIGVNLMQIPNQPIIFSADINGRPRKEDALIAFTWSHFINNTLEYDWLARMPMTKASVLAMNVVQEFVTQHLPTYTPIARFVVAGGSKRGWTTWMVGGMDDPRVVAIVPIVAPVANLVPQINEMWQSYGNWSFALNDYVHMDLMGWLNLPRFTEMLDIIDPLSYPDALAKIPKYVINACGDEFFMPDAAQYYWDSLSGGKYLYMVPNAEHSLAGHVLDVLGSAEQFVLAVFYNQLDILPQYSWEISEQGNTVTLTTLQTNYITGARVYYSQNNTARDWRLITCTDPSPQCVNVAVFGSEELTPISPGVYQHTLPLPPSGMYSAMMIEVSYNFGYPALAGSSRKPFHITSDLSIFPRGVYPYPPCPQDVCHCGYDCAINYYGGY